jgi:N-acetyl-1-D-myo-inositol-2-amino-2-deoxy-alpha-D-glucopyranoside deacetylase
VHFKRRNLTKCAPIEKVRQLPQEAATNSTKQVLLAVLAHPDDETFGTGGTLAHYAAQGVEVHLICATRGEVGDVEEQYMRGFDTVADRRVAELRCAAEKLGLKEVHFLGYRDSGMPGSPDNQHPMALAAQPVDKVAAEIAGYFRKLKPQVVITFDPIGGYRHPDHIAIHQATVRAFEAGEELRRVYPDADALPGYQPLKLYFQTIPRGFLRIAVFLLRLVGQDPRRFGRNHDIDIQSIAEVSFPTHAVVNFREVARLRDEASACHASQGGQQMNKGIQGWVRRMFSANETYMRAYPPAVKGLREKDLFEGI